MTTQPRGRRANTPAYYLGRPAAFWLRTYAIPRPSKRRGVPAPEALPERQVVGE